jgi:hypothetical protein
VLDPVVVEAIARVTTRAEEALLRVVSQGRARQEPDLTSRLVQAVEIEAEAVEGVTVELTVVDGLGPGAPERDLGADVVGVVRLAVGDLRVAKGFLAQSKRSGQQGIYLTPAEDRQRPVDDAYSHWLYRGAIHLPASGTVSVTKPSADLVEQCENMLRTTPDSFVFVFHEEQVAVVSASAVCALRNKPPNSREHSRLGTKRLDDFFVHLVDAFIGDPKLIAADTDSIRSLAAANRAQTGILLAVTGV